MAVATELAAALQRESLELGGAHLAKIRRKWSTIVGMAKRERASDLLRADLAEALEAAGVYANPSLLDPGLVPDDWVQLALQPFPAEDVLFPSERSLEEFVAHAMGNIEPFRGLRLIGRQFRVARCKLDILAEERRSGGRGDLVVVELKRAAAEEVIAQVVRYIDAVRESPRAKGREVRGLVVLGQPDDRAALLAAALAPHYSIECHCYRFAFEPVPATNWPTTAGVADDSYLQLKELRG